MELLFKKAGLSYIEASATALTLLVLMYIKALSKAVWMPASRSSAQIPLKASKKFSL